MKSTKYYELETGEIKTFTIESYDSRGKCYLAKDSNTDEEVWLFKDAIEYAKSHKIIYAYEVSESIAKTFSNASVQLSSNDYVWGGEIRDKRRNSMCARPYFRY